MTQNGGLIFQPRQNRLQESHDHASTGLEEWMKGGKSIQLRGSGDLISAVIFSSIESNFSIPLQYFQGPDRETGSKDQCSKSRVQDSTNTRSLSS